MNTRFAVAGMILVLGAGIGSMLRPAVGEGQAVGMLGVPGVIYVDGTKYPKTDVGIQAALDAAKAGTVVLAPGAYQLAQGIRMITSGQHVVCAGIGTTTLNYIGASDIPAIIDVGTSAEGKPNLYNISVNGCTLSGNAHVKDAIRTRGVHHSDFSHNSLINVTEAGIHTNFGVILNLDDLHTSSNEQGFATQPASCVILDGPGGNYTTTATTIKSPVCEGVSGSGIKFNFAIDDDVFSGTSEGNNIGAEMTANSANIRVTSTDFESNRTADVLWSGAYGGRLTNVTAQTPLGLVNATTSFLTIDGGVFRNITLGTGTGWHALLNLRYTGALRMNNTVFLTRSKVYDASASAYDADLFPGEALPFATKSAPYALTTSDSWVNVTGNTAITAPHAERGRLWTVFNAGAGTVTLRCDAGNINGGPSISVAPNTGREVTADGTNCWAR